MSRNLCITLFAVVRNSPGVDALLVGIVVNVNSVVTINREKKKTKRNHNAKSSSDFNGLT